MFLQQCPFNHAELNVLVIKLNRGLFIIMLLACISQQFLPLKKCQESDAGMIMKM